MNGMGMMGWWSAQGQFWQAQAKLCGLRGDVYRTVAQNCDIQFMKYRPLQAVELYCRMQAQSCDTQGAFCRMLASVLGLGTL